MARQAPRDKSAPAFPYSLPLFSPLYPPPPFEYRNGWSQFLVFRSDPDVIARYLPAPLVGDKSGTMTFMISRFFASGFGSYHEATLCALASFKGKPVSFPMSLILDSDIAVCGGREIWGWPKKIGRISFVERDGVVTSAVERGGHELIRAAVEVGPLAPPETLLGASADFICLKLIPSVKNGAPPEVAQLTRTTLSNFVPHVVYRGRATLALGGSPADRFDVFPVREIVDAFYYRSDFTLGDGEVVHDYLA
jgi:acetoacetate decarboxylase